MRCSLLLTLLVGAHALLLPRTLGSRPIATPFRRQVGLSMSEDVGTPQDPPPSKQSTDPSRAIGIISELKANAALFAAFAFGSLNLPSTLTVSESRVAGVASSVSVTKPAYGVPLLKAYVVLDAVTLCCFVVCVAVSQLLIYRLADGSYGATNTITQTAPRGSPQPDSAVATLIQQYGLEFGVARGTFAFGLTGLLVGTAVRVTASFNPSIAVPVTLVITSAAFSIFAFYMKTQRDVFVPLEEKSFGGTLVALFGLVLLLAAATSAGLLNPSNVTPQLADVATIKGG